MIAKPAAMPGIWGARKARPPAEQREQQQRPQAVEQDRAGTVLGQRRAGLGAGEQARDRRVGLGAPAQAQADQRREHPPAHRERHQRVLRPWSAAASTVTAASAVAAPALSRTVVLRKSTNRTVQRRLQQRLEQFPHAARAVDRQVGLARELGGRFVGADGHAQRARQHLGLRRARAVRGRRRGRWCRRRRTARPRRALRAAACAMPRPLSRATGGRTSSTLRPQCDREALLLARAARSPAPPPRRPPRRGRRASGRPRSRPCPRCARAAAGARPCRRARRTRARASVQAARSGSTSGRVAPGRSSSPPWLPT